AVQRHVALRRAAAARGRKPLALVGPGRRLTIRPDTTCIATRPGRRYGGSPRSRQHACLPAAAVCLHLGRTLSTGRSPMRALKAMLASLLVALVAVIIVQPQTAKAA